MERILPYAGTDACAIPFHVRPMRRLHVGSSSVPGGWGSSARNCASSTSSRCRNLCGIRKTSIIRRDDRERGRTILLSHWNSRGLDKGYKSFLFNKKTAAPL